MFVKWDRAQLTYTVKKKKKKEKEELGKWISFDNIIVPLGSI